MKQRIFGKTGRSVSEIGLGTWQLGTRWGDPFNKEEAFKILETAEAAGITFIDTADVYNGGKKRRNHRRIYCRPPRKILCHHQILFPHSLFPEGAGARTAAGRYSVRVFYSPSSTTNPIPSSRMEREESQGRT